MHFAKPVYLFIFMCVCGREQDGHVHIHTRVYRELERMCVRMCVFVLHVSELCVSLAGLIVVV